MSHIEKSKTQIRDLDVFEAACQRFSGAMLRRGQTQASYYAGRKAECDHAVHVDGVNFEIAVKQESDGSYSLGYDAYNYGPGNDGDRLTSLFGAGLNGLTDAYSAEFLHKQAREQGYTTTEETLADGTLLVTANSI